VKGAILNRRRFIEPREEKRKTKRRVRGVVFKKTSWSKGGRRRKVEKREGVGDGVVEVRGEREYRGGRRIEEAKGG